MEDLAYKPVGVAYAMKEKKRMRIVIAEDHAIVRKGLRTLLSKDPEMVVVGEASDGREAIQCTERFKPDLLLIDLSMPKMDGTTAIRELKRRNQKTKVLVLTMHKTEDNVLAALQAGADGYLLKDDTPSELPMAIRTVLEDKFYLSPGVSGTIVRGYLEGRKVIEPISAWERLTPREKEVLKLVAEGYKNREMAEQLCIDIKTIEKHRANIREKLDLHNTAALTKYAKEKGLIGE